MSTGRVCVVGSFMMDLVASAPRRPLPGETLIGTGFAMHLGGKGMNQAVAAARNGARVAMVGRLGNDEFGERFRAALAEEGIDDFAVSTDPSDGTGIGLPVVEPDGANSIIVVPRANSRLTVDDVLAAAPAITAADCLLLQFELPLDTAVLAARLARGAGRAVVLNPAPALSPPAELRGLVDYLIVNEGEAELLAGTANGASDAAGWLRQSWRASGVVVTVGERGALVAEGDGVWRASALTVPVVDTVGAGDAFSGALVARLALGHALSDAVQYATATASLSCTKAGGVPSIPSGAEVLAALAAREHAQAG